MRLITILAGAASVAGIPAISVHALAQDSSIKLKRHWSGPNENAKSWDIRKRRDLSSGIWSQKALADEGDDLGFGKELDRVVPVLDWNELTFFTELTVGTPPQRIRVFLDLSGTEISVPSSECDDSCDGHLRYTSSKSSTYVKNGTIIEEEDYMCVQTRGFASQDTVAVGSIAVKNQKFQEATSITRNPPDWGYSEWDGIIGLAPSSITSQASSPNLFQNMVSQGLLDMNLFSLKLPRGADDPGELMFGGINRDLYSGELKVLPLLNKTAPIFPDQPDLVNGRWLVQARSITVPGLAEISLIRYVAALETNFPGIGLPWGMVSWINSFLGFERDPALSPWDPPTIDCNEVVHLPNLTFNLAGHDFEITSREYTHVVEDPSWEGQKCFSVFMIWGEDWDEVPVMVLGSSFMRAWYGVFDLDNRTVSLATPRLKSEKTAKLELRTN